MALELTAAPAFAQTSAEPWDPWEPFNRRMFAIHNVLDRHFFAPAAHAFGRLPLGVRKPMTNFSRNLGEPIVFVNDLLQFRLKAAGTTFGRFAMNSTVGLAGFLDPASHNHMPHHDNGFGTTLGRWGAQPGPYLFIPLLGPSDFRDALGAGAGIFTNPLYYARFDGKVALGITTGAVNGLNARLDADQALTNINQTSTDPYATLRSYFLQNRAAEIHGAPAEPEVLPDFDFPTGTTGAAPSATPEGAAAPPGAPPAVSQPPSATGIPSISGGAAAVPTPEATPGPAPAPPSSTAPPESQPSAPPSASPKWLVEPETEAPLRTAGGK